MSVGWQNRREVLVGSLCLQPTVPIEAGGHLVSCDKQRQASWDPGGICLGPWIHPIPSGYFYIIIFILFYSFNQNIANWITPFIGKIMMLVDFPKFDIRIFLKGDAMRILILQKIGAAKKIIQGSSIFQQQKNPSQCVQKKIKFEQTCFWLKFGFSWIYVYGW